MQPLLSWKSGKYYIFWVHVCSLRYPSMQCEYVILSSVACPFLQYFSTLSHIRHDFRGEKRYWKQNVCFDAFFSVQVLSETFFILRRIERHVTINVYWFSCEVPVILFRFEWNPIFLYRFSKNNQILNFMKIHPMGAELFHAGGQTDMTKLIVTFRNSANASKKK